jgi:hypothetical protein
MALFIYHATVKIRDVQEKILHFERAGYTFVRELSPEEAGSVSLDMSETVLVFGHPMS